MSIGSGVAIDSVALFHQRDNGRAVAAGA